MSTLKYDGINFYITNSTLDVCSTFQHNLNKNTKCKN